MPTNYQTKVKWFTVGSRSTNVFMKSTYWLFYILSNHVQKDIDLHAVVRLKQVHHPIPVKDNRLEITFLQLYQFMDSSPIAAQFYCNTNKEVGWYLYSSLKFSKQIIWLDFNFFAIKTCIVIQSSLKFIQTVLYITRFKMVQKVV